MLLVSNMILKLSSIILVNFSLSLVVVRAQQSERRTMTMPMLVYRTTVYLFSIVVQVSCNFSGTYLHALLSMKEISHYLIIMATEMLWFSVILGSVFIFLCFVLTIIHCHTQEQNKLKIEPRIRLNYDMNNSFCTQCFHFFR